MDFLSIFDAGFYSTLVATCLGALFAFLSTLWLFRREGRAQSRARFDDALASLVEATVAHSSALREAIADTRRGSGRDAMPDDFGVIGAVANVRLQATDEEQRRIADAMREIVLEARRIPVTRQIAVITEIWPSLIIWRDGRPVDDAIDRMRVALLEGSKG